MSTSDRRRPPRRADADRNDHALLQAAREVLATDGAHASVAAIAAQAGVGIGSLYRRYRTKEELFERLTMLAIGHWSDTAEAALGNPDPWAGLADFIAACVHFGQGTLAPLAGSIEVSAEMRTQSQRGDELFAALVERAHTAGVLRPDVTAVDIVLLIEQLGRSPLVDQMRRQQREELVAPATAARTRLIAIAVDGLRAGHPNQLPGEPPSDRLLTGRWEAQQGRSHG